MLKREYFQTANRNVGYLRQHFTTLVQRYDILREVLVYLELLLLAGRTHELACPFKVNALRFLQTTKTMVALHCANMQELLQV